MDFEQVSYDSTPTGVGSQDGDAVAILDSTPHTGIDPDAGVVGAEVVLKSTSPIVEHIDTDERDRPRRTNKKDRRDSQHETETAPVESQRDSAPTQDVDPKPVVITQAPHTLGTGSEWPTNRVLLRGRIEQPKRKAMWLKGLASGGASYQQRTLLVVEPGMDDDFADLAPKKRIALLIPEGLPHLQIQMLAQGEGKEPREGCLVSIVGRMVLEKVRDPRYERESNFGGEMVTRLYVKVLEVRLIDEHAAADVALIRLNGVVEEVQRLNGPLNGSKFASGTAQQYHQVTMVTCEKFARPEPSAAPREVKTRVKMFVPIDTDGAAMLLVPGNHAQVEAEYVLTTAYLPKGHALLNQVDPTKLDWLRARPSEHLVVTNIIPAPDAQPLDGDAQIAARLAGRRPLRRRKRKSRAESAQTMA